MQHTVREITLDNGAKGLLLHVPGVDVVRMLVEFRAGFDLGDWQKYELPHVTEHLMFTNQSYPEPNQFSREVEKNGAFCNATTSDTSLAYEYECATFEAERIAGLIGTQITEPTFPARELTSELNNVADELDNDISDPGSTVNNNLQAAAYDMPDFRRRRDQLSTVTEGNVREWYRHTHTSDNMRFLVAGDVDFDAEVLPGLNVDLPRGERLEVPYVARARLQEPVVEYRDMPQIYYRFTSRCSQSYSYRELIAARIMSDALSAGFSATLFGEARDRGLVYDLAMRVGRDIHTTEWHFGGPVSPAHADTYFQLATDKIRQAQNGEISGEQFDRMKRLLRGNRARGYQTPGSLLNYYDMFLEDDHYEAFEEFYRLLDEVTLDEAARAFAGLFADNVWGVSFLGNVDETAATRYQDIVSPLWD
jgi:predicted Zn-dependent peptidase